MLDGVPRTIVQAEQLDALGVNIDYIIEVDILGAPFKVMNKFSSAIALLENESIVKQL